MNAMNADIYATLTYREMFIVIHIAWYSIYCCCSRILSQHDFGWVTGDSYLPIAVWFLTISFFFYLFIKFTVPYSEWNASQISFCCSLERNASRQRTPEKRREKKKTFILNCRRSAYIRIRNTQNRRERNKYHHITIFYVCNLCPSIFVYSSQKNRVEFFFRFIRVMSL